MEEFARGVIDYMLGKPPSVNNEVRKNGWEYAAVMHMNRGILPEIDVEQYKGQQ